MHLAQKHGVIFVRIAYFLILPNSCLTIGKTPTILTTKQDTPYKWNALRQWKHSTILQVQKTTKKPRCNKNDKNQSGFQRRGKTHTGTAFGNGYPSKGCGKRNGHPS
jgi:hypothetical protein